MESNKIIIIGAGISGVTLAVRLNTDYFDIIKSK
jgi:cation diffusion facilitator CzcD-associated flavoprotein CzcO